MLVRPEPVGITGMGIDMPGVPSLDSLAGSGVAAPLESEPKDLAAGRALRYKDRATRMALKAATNALDSAGLPVSSAAQVSPDLFGVVVSSNFGNIDTVCRVAETIRSSSASKTRPMDLPNASSNIVASSLAIWFGCKAANFTLCNGAHSGIDALHTASNVIRSGRASRMLVVGVEPLNPFLCKLMNESSSARSNANATIRLGEGAAAVVLESAAAAADRSAAIQGYLTGYGYDAGMDVSRSVQAARLSQDSEIDLWLTPGLGYCDTAASVERALAHWSNCRPRAILDLTSSLGELYGMLGVLQGIAGCLWLRANRGRTAVATSGACWGDGSASLLIDTQ